MKKTIKDLNIKDKKVIIRCDFNVPIQNGTITDDNRILESLLTIKYALDKNAKVILLSHLGRIKEIKDKKKYTLKPVAQRLSILLKRKVIFIPSFRGVDVENAISKMKSGQIVLLENTRFADLEGNLESNCDVGLSKYWASLGDVFINDAFATSHRKHASNVGVASNLPNAVGLLVQKELEMLKARQKKPYVVILGGSKVSDKIGVIDSLTKKADYILIGGAMAFTFLKASGFNVGKSLVENDYIDYCTHVLNKHEDKVILPIDVVTSKSLEEENINERFINEITDEEIGFDIGRRTVKVFAQYLNLAKTIFWNGPVGYFEKEEFSRGTRELLKIITSSKAKTIIGGGDTASAAINMGYKDKITHISTGGGASLELLEGKKLQGIEIIDEK